MTGLRYWIFAFVNRLHRRVWLRWTDPSADLPPTMLKRLRRQARNGADVLRRVERAADAALSAPVSEQVLLQPTEDAEFHHRPALFCGQVDRAFHDSPGTGLAVGPDLTLHHDLEEAVFSAALGTGPPSLMIEGYEMRGSFLSLAIALPDMEAPRTSRDRLIRLAYDFTMDVPGPVYARLNLRHGPNVEQITRALDLQASENWVEFDAFYTEYEPARGTAMWIDLIFEPPRMNALTIRDLAVMRRPRVSL
ncbi:MAG: DUF6478 family protein [Pseudomonadota bacterium]